MLKRLLVLFVLAGLAFGRSAVGTPLSDATHYPKLVHAELPLYPAVAWAAHISGTVEIQVTVEGGVVVEAQLKSNGSPYLSNPSLANVKSWQFQVEDRATFLVTYMYRIQGPETKLPENPKIELDLPRVVKVSARPFKPSCSDCASHSETVDPNTRNKHLAIPVVAKHSQ